VLDQNVEVDDQLRDVDVVPDVVPILHFQEHDLLPLKEEQDHRQQHSHDPDQAGRQVVLVKETIVLFMLIRDIVHEVDQHQRHVEHIGKENLGENLERVVLLLKQDLDQFIVKDRCFVRHLVRQELVEKLDLVVNPLDFDDAHLTELAVGLGAVKTREQTVFDFADVLLLVGGSLPRPQLNRVGRVAARVSSKTHDFHVALPTHAREPFAVGGLSKRVLHELVN